MDISLPIPQVIGTTSGLKNDGVIVGEVANLAVSSQAYYSYAHRVLYAFKVNDNEPITPTFTWIPEQDNLNDAVAVSPFTPLDVSNPYPELYLAVREGVNGFSFNVTTAGLGSFVIEAWYNSTSGYQVLPNVTYSENFFKTTGINFFTFEIPDDWAEDYVGYPTPPERWLVLKIISGTYAPAPIIEGGWELTAEISDTSDATSNPPFLNPYSDLLPGIGDTLYVVSVDKPFSLRVTYQDALETGNVTYSYSKVDGTYSPLTVVSDSSEGFTVENSQNFETNDLTAAGDNASSSTNNVILGDGYVYGTINTLPNADSNSGDRISIGFSTLKTGDINFELAAYYDGTDNVYRILYDNVAIFTSTQEVEVGDVMSILRYEGKIYFQVNGTNINPEAEAPEEIQPLYGRVFASKETFALDNYILADWETRQVIPTVLEFNNSNFTIVNDTATQVFPAHYFITWNPPTDFASVSALLSKTGSSGFGIGIITEFETQLLENIVLLDEKFLTSTSSDNIYFQNGLQQSLNLTNLVIQNPEEITTPQTFLYIVNTQVGQNFRTVTFTPGDDTSGIYKTTVQNTGMTGIIIMQVDGEEVLEVGTPSYIYLGT